MSGSPNDEGVSREELHTRSIRVTGYRRSDGLYEVEGRLVDTKPFAFRPISGDDVVEPGQPIHDMAVRIVYDEQMTVRDVITAGHVLPYAACAAGPATLKSLIGLSMTKGWSAETRKRLSGVASCTHLAGLMAPMAATAFQSMVFRIVEKAAAGEHEPNVDSCIAYSRHGDLIRTRYPSFYIASKPGNEAA